MDVVMRRVRGSFALKAGLALLLIVLGDVMFFQNRWHGGVFGLYGLAMLAALAVAQPAVLRRLSAGVALGFAALYALAMAWNASPLAWCLFWIAAAMALLLPRTAGFDDGWRWFQRVLFHGLIAVAGPLPDMARRARVRARRWQGQSTLRRTIPVLVLPLLGSAAFVALFAVANPVLEQWIASLNGPSVDGETVLRVILWVVLLWLCWGVMRPHVARRLAGTFDGSGDADIPGVSGASVLLSLAAFNGLFLMQNAMDAAWLWGLVPLPDGMPLAEYAHRSAYPLVGTALLAALFVLVALRPGSTTAADARVRWLMVLWIGQNLFLLFNAGLRTVDYVDAYSLTVLRISALLWMALVAVGLVLVAWRMLAGKSAVWLINTNLAAVGLVLTGASFVDLGAVAAQWNVRHAREVDGTGAVLDLCYLNNLGGSALLPLIELEQRRLPADLHRRVRMVRLMVHHRLIDDVRWGAWDWLSARRLEQAEQALGGKIGPNVDYAYAMCDGSPVPPPPPALPPLEMEPAEPIVPGPPARALTNGAGQ